MVSSRRWALASLALAALLSSLGTSIANVALPTLVTDLGASFQQVQWVVLAYLLAVTTLIVSAGKLGDLFGRRKLLLTGILLFTLASLLAAMAPSLPWLIVARLAQGAGSAVMLALSIALIGDAVPREETGRAMGVLGSMSAIGTALGPSLGGLLISWWSWRAIFVVTASAGALGFVLARACLLRERPAREVAARFDMVGSLLLAIALAAFTLALTMGRGHFGFWNAALLTVLVVTGVALVVLEQRIAHPLIELRLLRRSILRVSLLASGLVATVAMTTLVVGPFYLSGALGLRTASVGLVMSVGPVITALAGIPSGRLTDRLGSQRLTTIGLVMMIVGAGGLSLLPIGWGVPGYVGSIVVLTAGYSLFQTANNTAVMADVPAADRGVISGLLSLSRNVGLLTGASAMGAIYAAASATIGSGLHATFAVAVILLLIALFAVVRWRHVHGYSASGTRSAVSPAPVA